MAQYEPQPEVDVVCENYYDQGLNMDPRYSNYYGEVFIQCTLINDNLYSVEVETALQWIYSDSHDSSVTITINGNSEDYVQFQISGSDDAPAGFETLTFEATVIEYGNIRECTGCETTSHTLEIEVLEWTHVKLEIISESPEGTFGLDRLSDFQICGEMEDYQLNARIEVNGNHDIAPAIGFDHDSFSDNYNTLKPGAIKVSVPDKMDLDIGVGESVEVELTFTLEVLKTQAEDVYVLFMIILGESDDVDMWLDDSYGYYDVEYYLGGCVVEGESYRSEDFSDIEPIIIETSSDDSRIYLLAGIGGATTVCLLIALIAILVRKRD